MALYGIDFLLAKKLRAKIKFDRMTMSDFIVRKREEISLQMEALEQLRELGNIYGFDISKPAKTAKEWSPKSYKTEPGIMVSRSMIQIPFFVLSSMRILLSLV